VWVTERVGCCLERQLACTALRSVVEVRLEERAPPLSTPSCTQENEAQPGSAQEQGAPGAGAGGRVAQGGGAAAPPPAAAGAGTGAAASQQGEGSKAAVDARVWTLEDEEEDDDQHHGAWRPA